MEESIIRKRFLIPWAMPERGKNVLEKSKAEVCYLHGPKGELPTLKELIQAVRQADVLMPTGVSSKTEELETFLGFCFDPKVFCSLQDSQSRSSSASFPLFGTPVSTSQPIISQ
ncbi:MAG: hypothetical protein A2V86_01465 [Deltaproteobacteria bacterium RBG_16_49_23]|nr:MAG: hypothetical protein A2V86_01465 [Deltaproteobacteria bacterium RBG_16_49_23]